ncbi:MAG TPA: glycosyltransferase family 4 protein [Terriglobales bacterium]|nr:glycosyltransferase family 4 protein [Terriglobales bacterium]
MKILYVSQYYPPEMGAPAARVSELSRHWRESGHEVTVLTGFPNHPTGVLHRDYRRQFHRLICNETVDGVRVVRSWLLPLPNGRAHERILNYSSFCLSAALSGTFLARPDIVIATSPQLLVGLAGRWIATRHSVPFIFEVRDLWPESLTAVGMGDQSSLMNRTLGAVADFLYAQADRIVVVTPASREHLIVHRGVNNDKISVIQNGVESAQFRPAPRNEALKQRLGMEGRFVVGYLGTIGMAHALETLVQAARMLGRMAPEVAFLVVGEGAAKKRIQEVAKAAEVDNIVFVEQQLRDRIPEFIHACDACLVLLRKTDLFRTVMPTKMLEFMSCGRPVLLGVDGQARQVIEQAKAGMFVQPENASALVDAICNLRGNPDLCEALGRNGRDYILAHYSRRQSATAYLSVLENVLGEARSKKWLRESCLRTGNTVASLGPQSH